VVCFYEQNRVVIRDMETGEQKEVEVREPWKCVGQHQCIVVVSENDNLHVFTTDGDLKHIIPETKNASCVAVHPVNPDIIAIGFHEGAVSIWNSRAQAYVSTFKVHDGGIASARFASDGRLFLSSWDTFASMVTIDSQYRVIASVKFAGHNACVSDILPLSSDVCVTCSLDTTITFWDCLTGACIKTLPEFSSSTIPTLVLGPTGREFACATLDKAVIIWSSETFEILRRIEFPGSVKSLVADSDTLYVGVRRYGIMSCNILTGEVGSFVFHCKGNVTDLAYGAMCVRARLLHTLNSTDTTVPSRQVWTPSTHALWSSSAQHRVHMAVAVLWKARTQGRQVQLAFELEEVIFEHVV
jgi:WD40 repeat protein